jgi:AcrR family transcriptional regulator
MSLSDQPTARARLLDAAVELALEGGPAALTGRASTAGLGASPSSVNYHFGGLPGLVRAVHDEIALRQEAWRVRRLERLEAGGPGPAWAFVAGTLADLASAARRERLALLEFASLARETEPPQLQAARQDHVRQAAFWRAALGRVGCPADDAGIWAAAAFAATPFVLLDEDPVEMMGWLAPAMLRLHERLQRRASPAAISWLAPVERPPAAPPRPQGAQRLVDAALQVIAEQGLPAATLRAVAEAAGLSLGSTTYFFKSKAEIIHAAFTQLRDQASQAALRAKVAADAESSLKTVNAIDALTLAGARSPDLRPVALSLRSLTGHTSTQFLAARSPGSFDRLDGFLSSLITQGIGGEGHWSASSREEIEARRGAMTDRLFPVGAPPPG